ncbi:MAG: hypothetical protein KJ850_05780 [Gammaproteobacteria bacterium]|nr:hypothetical protein [Gammaproteobacteria bacterium]MBU1624543.1 hypothetical protein [Gammaproteobacteria bacterium]MBU1982387.1 hypothetical protein [Gammaproteobacteria bacterium]
MVTPATKKATPVARKSASTTRSATTAKAKATPKPVSTARRTTAAAKPAAKPATKPAKKVKVVRDSFSMPQDDYALIAKLKERLLASGLQVKKSALLRAGLQLLDKSSALQLKRVISGLTPIKTGRPKKH